MAATVYSRTYDTLLSLTADYFQPQLADNIHTSVPLLWWLKNRGRNGGFKYVSGGHQIRVPVIWQTNDTAGSYSKYDTLTLKPTDEITSAFEDWSELAATISISRREMLQNNGDAALLNLLTEKVNVAELALKQEMHTQLIGGTVAGGVFTQGNNGKDLNPLGKVISYQDVTLHRIAQGTDTWFRPKRLNAAAGAGVDVLTGATHTIAVDTFLNFKRAMSHLYNWCGNNNIADLPDFILMDQAVFEPYESKMSDQQRYGNFGDENAASFGFESLKFKGALIMWSDAVPDAGGPAVTPALAGDQSVYMINSRWLDMVVHRDSDFAITPFEEAINQTAIYSKILFMGQLVTSNPRMHGVMANITPAEILTDS